MYFNNFCQNQNSLSIFVSKFHCLSKLTQEVTAVQKIVEELLSEKSASAQEYSRLSAAKADEVSRKWCGCCFLFTVVFYVQILLLQAEKDALLAEKLELSAKLATIEADMAHKLEASDEKVEILAVFF